MTTEATNASPQSEHLSRLLQTWTDGLKDAFTAMGIAELSIEEPWDETEIADAEQLWIGQILNVPNDPCIWVGAGKTAWRRLGTYLQRQAGIEEPDDASVLDTYREVIAQSFSALAAALGVWLNRELTCTETTAEEPPPDKSAAGRTIRLATEDGLSSSLCLVCSRELLPLLAQERPAGAGEAEPESHDLAIDFESVLDLDMPVSVTLGAAKIDLQRILTLTEGSVIRLSRTPSDYMQLLINGRCVAHGELVAARGQYAIRIHDVCGAERLAQVQSIAEPEERRLTLPDNKS